MLNKFEMILSCAFLLTSCGNTEKTSAKIVSMPDQDATSTIGAQIIPESIATLAPPAIAPLPTQVPEVEIGIGGDVMVGRSVYQASLAAGDFDVLDGLASIMDGNDVNLINLESPPGYDCSGQGPNRQMTFCTDSRFLPSLAEDHVVAALANNHEEDVSGPMGGGVDISRAILKELGIDYIYSQDTGLESLVIKEINGIKLGFMSYNLVGTNNDPISLGPERQYHQDKLLELVREHKGKVDWLVLALHWGAEYDKDPELWQREYAHKLIDEGVDIIAGSHPHVVMEPVYEIYSGKFISYSGGNLVFDQNELEHPGTRDSVWINLKLDKDQILGVDTHNIRIDPPSFQPVLVD